MTTPLVSVVIPTYNHAQYLPIALESVQSQTMGDWEAIVIDNYSSDSTVDIVSSISDERIRLVQFANNGVIAASRNHGISLTAAPYVAFLDSDDSWRPEKLELVMARLKRGADLVCHGETWVGPGERRRIVKYGPAERSSYDGLLFGGNSISTSAVVVDRKRLIEAGGFDEDPLVTTAEDYDLWLKLASNGTRMVFMDEILGEYLIHAEGQSRSPLRNMKAVMAVFERHIAMQGATIATSSRAQRRRGTIYYSGGRSLQAVGEFAPAWEYYFRSIRLNPTRPQTWAAMLLNALRVRL